MDEQKRIFTDGTIKVCATDRKKNYKVRLQMLNGLKNRNGWVYENIEKHLDEFADIPVLYSVIGNKVANGHDFEVKVDPKTGKKYASFIGATSEHMAGWIVETIGNGKKNVRIENIDGVEWVVAEAIFPTFYNKEFLDEMQANGNEMKISIETLVSKSRVEDGVEYEEEYEVVGVTVLGRGVAEAVAGANIRAASVAEDGFEKLRLRAASYYESTDTDNADDNDDSAQKVNEKEQKKTMSKVFNKEDLNAKFNGYTVLDVNGATVALLSDNGRFYSYTFGDGEETVIPEKIHENSVVAVIGEGEESVSVSGEQIATPLVAKINAFSKANEALTADVARLNAEVATLKENEKKRRIECVRKAINTRFNEIKNTYKEVEFKDCEKELCKDEKLAEYAECEKDGEFCGEEVACKDVDALCMDSILNAKKDNSRKVYAWERGDVKDNSHDAPKDGSFEAIASKYNH